MIEGVPMGPKPYKPPTAMERIKAHANEAKIHATGQWIRGEITDKKHKQVHSRANHVMKHAKEYK